MMNVRTRFAPSPTGFIHLGNVWVAFLNWLYTRQHQGKLVLRIEDIDQTRSRKEYAQALMEDLDWLGLDWDEGRELCIWFHCAVGTFVPVSQMRREMEAGGKSLSMLLHPCQDS